MTTLIKQYVEFEKIPIRTTTKYGFKKKLLRDNSRILLSIMILTQWIESQESMPYTGAPANNDLEMSAKRHR